MSSRLVVLLVGAALLRATTATAQGGQPPPKPVPIPPVEVIATRVPEAPHDVPASIEVISGKDLRARGATTLRDALSLAAGVAVAPGGDAGPAGAVPEFWGLREFDAFLLVVDGVPWGGAFNPALTTLNMKDVERIEVLRGPAPVTYGATSFVGVIHVVHSAAAARTTYLSAYGGNYGSGGVSADIAMPSSGSWKSRVTADFDRQGFADDRTAYSRGHALWRLARTDSARSTWLNVDVNVLRQDPASPHPREGPQLSTVVPLDANYNPNGAFLNENRFALSGGWERPVLSGATWGTTLSYTFSSQDLFRGFITNVSDTPNNASGFKEKIDVNDIYGDTHLIFREKSHVRLMTGVDLLVARGEGKGATFDYTVPLDASTATNVPEPSTLDKDSENERTFAGLYGSAEWRPSARVAVNAGLRFNITTEKRGEGEEVSDSRPSGSIGAMVGLWEQGLNHLRLFANYRDTFKPAAFDFSLAENEGVLDPETSQSIEGGLKMRLLEGRWDAELSAFRMDFTNLVTATVINNLPALINAGETRFKGVELATDFRLTDDVTARATWSWHDGKFVDFVQEFGGVPTQLAGNRFEMSANTLYSAGVTLAPERGLVGSVTLNYTGDRYLNKRNTALAPAFTTVDLSAGYRMDRAEIRLDARNLGDARDAVSESEFGDAQYYRMTARTIQARVIWHH